MLSPDSPARDAWLLREPADLGATQRSIGQQAVLDRTVTYARHSYQRSLLRSWSWPHGVGQYTTYPAAPSATPYQSSPRDAPHRTATRPAAKLGRLTPVATPCR